MSPASAAAALPMGWLDRIFKHRYRSVPRLGDVCTGRVEIRGRVEAIDILHEPLTGEPCVAMEYRAWPPHPAGSLDGLFESSPFSARQSVDFVVSDEHGKVLVRVAPGTDVLGFHDDLLARFGVQLRAEVETVPLGADVRIAGRVSFHRAGGGSPLRNEPYTAVVEADRFWLC